MKTEISSYYDYLINIFVDSNSERKPLRQKHLEDGYVYATDGRSIVRIKESLKYDPADKYPNVQKLFTEIEKKKKAVIKTEELAHELSHCMMVLDQEKCEDCEGTGEITCEHCNSAYGCESCFGIGSTGEKAFARMNFTCFGGKANLRFTTGHVFFPNVLHKLFLAALTLKKEKIEFFYSSLDKGIYVNFGDIEIICMPATHPF